MKSVGCICKILKVPVGLEKMLREMGKTEHFRHSDALFRAGDVNAGVFLVGRGEVCLQMPGTPHLDRVFPPASLLGLPSTFTGNPYSFTAACITDCEVVNVARDQFLDLMRIRADFCQQVTELLSREMTFILSVYGKHGRMGPVEKEVAAQKHQAEMHLVERPNPSSTAVTIPIVCPICWDHTIERLEGIALSASNTAGRNVSGASVYRCSHWHPVRGIRAAYDLGMTQICY